MTECDAADATSVAECDPPPPVAICGGAGISGVPLRAQVPIGDPDEDEGLGGDEDEDDEDDEEEDDEEPWQVRPEATHSHVA